MVQLQLKVDFSLHFLVRKSQLSSLKLKLFLLRWLTTVTRGQKLLLLILLPHLLNINIRFLGFNIFQFSNMLLNLLIIVILLLSQVFNLLRLLDLNNVFGNYLLIKLINLHFSEAKVPKLLVDSIKVRLWNETDIRQARHQRQLLQFLSQLLFLKSNFLKLILFVFGLNNQVIGVILALRTLSVPFDRVSKINNELLLIHHSFFFLSKFFFHRFEPFDVELNFCRGRIYFFNLFLDNLHGLKLLINLGTLKLFNHDLIYLLLCVNLLAQFHVSLFEQFNSIITLLKQIYFNLHFVYFLEFFYF